MIKLIIGNKNYSSWSLRPWLGLRYWNIPFDEILIPLYQPESKAAIFQYSPSGKVPVLLDGDTAIWDSLAMLEWIAEQVAARSPQESCWPTDPSARAIARCVSAEMHSGFVALRENLSMDIKAGTGNTPKPYAKTTEVQQDIDRIQLIWQNCRTQFGQNLGGPFLFGKFSIADAMYAPVVSRFRSYGVNVGSVQQAYADAIWALPAMQDWVASAITETIPFGQ
jgi:glutathione S-transferase